MKHAIKIVVSDPGSNKTSNWLKQNGIRNYHAWMEWDSKNHTSKIAYFFEKEEDAFKFKMRWY